MEISQRRHEQYLKNRDKIIAISRAYSKTPARVAKRRQTSLMTKNGTIKGLNKAPYPDDGCEMCKKIDQRLAYHHWNDNNPSMGMWLCGQCHWFVEGIEKGLQLQRYLDLKLFREREYGR